MPEDLHGVDRRRLLSRLGGEYQLDAARRVARSMSRDVATVLVFLEISRANVAALTASRETVAEPHAGVPGLPPDHQREPISVYMVARNLHMPYETARRHVRKLTQAGLCETVAGGVIIPARAILDPRLMAAAAETFAATVAFVQTTGRLGVSAAGHRQPPSPDQFRQVNRAVSAYCLETACQMARVMDLDPGSVLILRAVNLANVRHVTQDPDAAPAHAGLADILPDAERRPISVYGLAKYLLLPYETVRRSLLQLEAKGLVRREAGGLIVPAEVVARPAVVAGVMELVANTEAFLVDLAAAGLAYQPEV
ncbi:MAG: hypothetical protein V4597_01300 [Pseudomonadota bacterium]